MVNCTGIMFSEGPLWKEQRRFTLRQLRDLGFGKTSAEDLIREEIHELVEAIRAASKADAGRVVNLKGIFNVSVLNVLWAIIGGRRYKHDDIQFKQILGVVESFFRSGNAVSASFNIPESVLKVLPFLEKYVGFNGQPLKKMAEFVKVQSVYKE